MPKMKTVKAVKARFGVTATGKLTRRPPGKRHLLSGKTSKRKRQLSQSRGVDAAHQATYTKLMGVSR